MDFAPARLLRGLFIAWLAAVALCAFGVSHAAPVNAASPLAAEDSPAPDDGGDAEPTDEPTDEPSDEPTVEPSAEPTVEPTQATTPRANAEDSDGSDDDTSSSNSGSDDPSNDTGAVTGSGGGPGDDAASDPQEASADDTEPANSESSSLGWILLTGGLASAAGAFAIYRRDPAVLAWPWLGHAH